MSRFRKDYKNYGTFHGLSITRDGCVVNFEYDNPDMGQQFSIDRNMQSNRQREDLQQLIDTLQRALDDAVEAVPPPKTEPQFKIGMRGMWGEWRPRLIEIIGVEQIEDDGVTDFRYTYRELELPEDKTSEDHLANSFTPDPNPTGG